MPPAQTSSTVQIKNFEDQASKHLFVIYDTTHIFRSQLMSRSSSRIHLQPPKPEDAWPPTFPTGNINTWNSKETQTNFSPLCVFYPEHQTQLTEATFVPGTVLLEKGHAVSYWRGLVESDELSGLLAMECRRLRTELKPTYKHRIAQDPADDGHFRYKVTSTLLFTKRLVTTS